MSDDMTLDDSMIDRLIAALRGQQVPMVEHLNAGLSDKQMDTLVTPLGIRLPEEARVWWRYANGVPRDAPADVALSPAGWWWAPLEEIVQHCREMRVIGSEDVEEVLPGEPSLYKASWLPIVIGDGMLVIDTSQAMIAPVYLVNFADIDPDVPLTPDLPSLGALVQAWTSALENRAIWYDHDNHWFNIDEDRLDGLGISTAVI